MSINILCRPILKLDKVRFHSILDYFIFICFEIFILMDLFTGFLLSRGLPSIGIPFKLFLMFLLFFSIKNENKFLLLLYFITLMTVSSIIYSFSITANLSDSLSMLLKIMMYPFLLEYIEDTYIKLHNGKELIKRICIISFYIIVFNQILGILGIGLSSYGDSTFGIKGFFYDANAMAVVCFCLFVFFYSIEKNKLFSIIIILCSFLLGTKTSILAIILYFFAYNFSVSKLKTKKYIILFFIVTLFIIWYLIFQTDVFSYHIEKMKWLYELFDGHILSVILSGRDIDLHNTYEIFKENFSIKTLLFGMGFKNENIIELDFFDCFFSFGILYTLPIVLCYLYVIMKNRKVVSVTLFNLLMILIVFTSGHVWFNTSTSLFFIINNIYGRFVLNEKKNKCYITAT